MKKYLLLFLLSYQFLPAQISPMLASKMTQASKLPVLLVFQEQEPLADWNNEWTKEEKGLFVFRSLNKQAEKQQARVQQLLQQHKIPFRSFAVANCIHAVLSPETINILAQYPEIERICFDSPQRINLPTTDESIHMQQRGPDISWGLQKMQVPAVWDLGIKGKGVVVAGEDTGVKWDVGPIKERYKGYSNGQVDHNYHWHDAIHAISPLSGSPDNPCGLNVKEPCDDNAHGTHTVGTMVGSADDVSFGVAPEAQWIGCRNMERGNGAPSTYIECFEFFLAPHDLDGKKADALKAPHVINNSWYCSLEEGCDTSTFPVMERVVDNLRKAGIVVVVSAGNDGAACSTLNHIPALFDGSFTVGSVKEDLQISGFSSNGPVVNYKEVRVKPNVVAPGSDVISVLPNGTYASWSGTSMAGPHVAGLVALIISANPNLAGQVERIEQIIEETAQPLVSGFDCWPYTGTTIPNNTFGFGFVNAKAAVDKARTVVSTHQQERIQGKVYPNPAKDYVVLDPEYKAPGVWTIEDVMGRKILHQMISKEPVRIDVRNWEPGIYYVSSPAGKYQSLIIHH